MHNFVATLLLAITTALVGGCGQMGPLYMPEPEAQPAEPASPAPTSQAPADTP